MTQTAKTETPTVPIMTGDQALRIANADVAQVYRDLSGYALRLALEEDGWPVDYKLKDPRRKGGGPHYILHWHTGVNLTKRYTQ